MNLYRIVIENDVKMRKTEEIEGVNKYEAIGKVMSYFCSYRTYFRIIDIKQLTQQEMI